MDRAGKRCVQGAACLSKRGAAPFPFAVLRDFFASSPSGQGAPLRLEWSFFPRRFPARNDGRIAAVDTNAFHPLVHNTNPCLLFAFFRPFHFLQYRPCDNRSVQKELFMARLSAFMAVCTDEAEFYFEGKTLFSL